MKDVQCWINFLATQRITRRGYNILLQNSKLGTFFTTKFPSKQHFPVLRKVLKYYMRESQTHIQSIWKMKVVQDDESCTEMTKVVQRWRRVANSSGFIFKGLLQNYHSKLSAASSPLNDGNSVVVALFRCDASFLLTSSLIIVLWEFLCWSRKMLSMPFTGNVFTSVCISSMNCICKSLSWMQSLLTLLLK